MRLKHEVSAGANTVMKCFNPKYFTSCTCYLHSREVIQSQLFYVLPMPIIFFRCLFISLCIGPVSAGAVARLWCQQPLVHGGQG